MSVGQAGHPPTPPQFLPTSDILAVIGVVLRIVAEAWDRVLRDRALNEAHRHNERATAGLLRHRMILVERKRNPRSPGMIIKAEVGVTSEDEEVVVGSIDIAIIYSFGDEPDLHLECKRVSSTKGDDDKRLAREYVAQGVLRFVGKYGRGHAWGVMVGFVVDGNAEGAAKLIAEKITQYKNEPPHVLRDWAPEARFGPHLNLFNTRHRKVGGSPIELLHVFLPFPAE
jgi:hypothetical protein